MQTAREKIFRLTKSQKCPTSATTTFSNANAIPLNKAFQLRSDKLIMSAVSNITKFPTNKFLAHKSALDLLVGYDKSLKSFLITPAEWKKVMDEVSPAERRRARKPAVVISKQDMDIDNIYSFSEASDDFEEQISEVDKKTQLENEIKFIIDRIKIYSPSEQKKIVVSIQQNFKHK